MVRFDGQASVSQYESLLLSLTYTNNAEEPSPGNRSISITLSDGIQQDMTAVIVIVVLTNDNILTLDAESFLLTFPEGSGAIAVGTLSGVMLMDDDNDAVIENLVISLNGNLEEESREFLVVDTSFVVPGSSLINGDRIEMTRISSIQNYQVMNR